MPRRHDLELFLKQSEIFRRLDAAARGRLAEASRERTFGKGETPFEEGQPADSVWLMRTGRVHMLHYAPGGQVQTTCVMTVGESFCCLPTLDRGVYPATAVAATPATALQIPLRVFHEVLGKTPAMLEETLNIFCHRLRQVEAKGCLAHDPVELRVAQALLTLREKFGDTIPLTRQEVAELAGTTVETVIRTVSRFQQEGWVRSGRGSIHLLNPDALQRLLA